MLSLDLGIHRIEPPFMVRCSKLSVEGLSAVSQHTGPKAQKGLLQHKREPHPQTMSEVGDGFPQKLHSEDLASCLVHIYRGARGEKGLD